jgi:leukotriene-A4 hydrolase
LYSLEKLIGKEKWDKFIPHYFTTWKYKSLDSYDFKGTLLDFFASDAEASKKLDWDAIFYTPGLPKKPDFDTSMVDECYALASKWHSFSDSKASGKSSDFTPSSNDIKSWLANQSVVFLEALQSLEKPLHPSVISVMDQAYEFGASHNVELSSRFFVLGLMAGDKSVCKPAAALAGSVGRMKFVRPLYKNLSKVDRELAIKTFEEHKDFYHPICRAMVQKWLFGEAAAGAQPPV